MGWWITLGILACLLLLLLLPVGVHLWFDPDAKVPLLIKAFYLFSFQIFPQKEKRKKPADKPADKPVDMPIEKAIKKAEKETNQKTTAQQVDQTAQKTDPAAPEKPFAHNTHKKQTIQFARLAKNSTGKRSDTEKFTQTLQMLTGVLEAFAKPFGKLLGRITLDRICLEVRLCEGDPADTALSYGRLMAVCNGLLGLANCVMKVRFSKVEILPDMQGEETIFQAKGAVRLHTPLWAVLAFGVSGGWRLLKTMMREQESGNLPHAPKEDQTKNSKR